MSMSTHVIGFRPPDEKWERMKAVWDACVLGEIPIPHEVQEFFDDREPDEAGVEVQIQFHKWVDTKFGSAQGVEVDVRDLPADITIIRFYNSW